MIQTKTNEHNGVTYKKIESDKKINGALAFGKMKLILNGYPAIETMSNSYKFGNEVQLTVFNQANSVKRVPRTEYAVSYDRIEIFINKEEFTKMCIEFLKNNGIDF